jgi:hypothetical protein
LNAAGHAKEMSTPLVPQEVYLLERYSSLEYFGELRDHFATMQ